MAKPPFDPSKPFQAASGKPAFDPTKPFERADSGETMDQTIQRVAALPDSPFARNKKLDETAGAAGRGALQGATANFGDEIQGAMGAGAQFLATHPALQRVVGMNPFGPLALQPAEDMHHQPLSLGNVYRAVRDEGRAGNVQAQAAHPTAYLGGNVGGAVASMALVPGSASKSLAARLGAMTAQGAASGLGGSGADLTSGSPQAFKRAAFDTGVGTLLGLGAGVVGEGLSAGGNAIGSQIAGRGAAKVSAAEAKAAEIGTQKAAAATQSARSAAGQDAQALYRALEHIDTLRSVGTPEAMAKLQQMEADGTIQAIRQQLLERTIDELPGKLGKSLASRAAFQDAAQTEAQRAADLAAEAEVPRIGQHAKELFKSYGEPVLGAVAGDLVGDQFGHNKLGAALGTAGGLIFGRTRAGKALLTRLAKPGVQLALGRGLEGLGGVLSGVGNTSAAVGEGLGMAEPTISAAEARLLAHPAIALALSGNGTPPAQAANDKRTQLQQMAALLAQQRAP